MSDIVAPAPGQVLPETEHLDSLLDFVREWDRKHPMVIHCFAGVSRSTASAYIAACALAPHRDEHRNCASSEGSLADRDAERPFCRPGR